MSEVGDELAGSFNYCTDLFNQETIERISRNFERLLKAIVENSSAKVKDLRLLTDEKRKQILVDWNDTKAPYPKDKTIYQLFEEQAQDYRESVLPPNITARVSIEAASPMGWERYIGSTGRFIGMSWFGASAPAATLYEKFGLTAQHIVEEVNAILK